MAKGQLRGNKEARKPKMDKAPAKAETPFGTQVKLAGATGQAAGASRK